MLAPQGLPALEERDSSTHQRLWVKLFSPSPLRPVPLGDSAWTEIEGTKCLCYFSGSA